MEFLWILVAFFCGFAARQIGLPPLVGYLFAGFGLNAVGVEAFTGLETLTNIGITLLLFTIGLKIDFRDLARVEVWGSASSHMLLWNLSFTAVLMSIGALIMVLFGSNTATSIFGVSLQTALLLGFAFSFSSTVCVMKILEDNAELKTRHGDLSIGVLVIQDIVAVVFLAIASGAIPSPWAFSLLLLPLLRPLMFRLLSMCGHGELLVLVGFFFALGGPELFKVVGLKGDLGALALGMILAGSAKANELYKSLTSFKDLFLIGFFLTIGFSALPTWETLGWALIVVAALPIKMLLFFTILIGLGMRGRTAFLSSLALMNFSEFGLIVASFSVDAGWMSQSALVVLALAVSISFIVSTFLYDQAHEIYGRVNQRISRFERASARSKNPYEQPVGAEVLIIGMGRVGGGAYQALETNMGSSVWGVEADQDRVLKQKEEGIRVVFGDADDIDFWQQQLHISQVRLIMLAIPSVQEMKNIIYQLKQTRFEGRIAAVARFDDECEELVALGADVVFNYYLEVGAGFAEECAHLLQPASSETDLVPSGTI